jgi:hypothetical protein
MGSLMNWNAAAADAAADTCRKERREKRGIANPSQWEGVYQKRGYAEMANCLTNSVS